MTHHTAFQRAARAGLAARGVVYLIVAALALTAVFGAGGGGGDPSPASAFRKVETAPAGQILLALLALGLLLYSLWRFAQGILDPENEGAGAKGLLARAGCLASGVSHFLLAGSAVLILLGRNEGGGGGATQSFAQFMLGQPFGRAVLAAAGLALAASGAAQIWRAWKLQYEKKLAPSPAVRRLRPLTRFGVGGRGALFILIGGFIAAAGLHTDASEAGGLAETFAWLRNQPYGVWLYALAAVALLGYGVYSFIEARYRRIESPS